MLLQEWYNCFRYISFVSWWGRLEVVHSRTVHFKFAPPLSQWRTTRTFGLSIVRRLGPVSGSRVKKTQLNLSCHALLVRHKMQVQIFKCYHFPEKCGCKRNKHHSTTTYHNPKNNKLQNKEKSSNMVGTPTVSLSLSLAPSIHVPRGVCFVIFLLVQSFFSVSMSEPTPPSISLHIDLGPKGSQGVWHAHSLKQSFPSVQHAQTIELLLL